MKDSTRLLKYSAFAASVLTISDIASAEIVYTDIDPDFEVDIINTADIDFDGDGVRDVAIWQFTYTNSGYGVGSAVIVNFDNGAMGMRGSSGIPALSLDDKIGSSYTFDVGIDNIANRYSFTYYSPGVYNTGGVFNGLSDAYIGVSFNIGAGTHYGWIRVADVSWTGLKVVEYAYEDVPGVPIRAGSKCSTPSALAATLISPTLVSLSWDGDADANLYQLRGGVVGSGVLATKISSTDSKVVGVTPGQAYEWQVRSSCSDGSETLFSNLNSFSVPVVRTGEQLSGADTPFEIIDGVVVSPNPAKEFLRANFNSSFEGEEIIEIVDLLGRTVHVESVYLTKGVNSFGIELENLSSGVYLLKVGAGEGQQIEKFELL